MTLSPESEADCAEAVAAATGPLVIRGGGTRPVGAPVTGEVLETGGMRGVVLHDPGALTLVVRAGTSLAEVEETLAAEGQRLPFEPMDHRALLGTTGTPTIGGVVAANVSGPRRVQAGACRDFLLGLRFVDGQGTVVKNGGRVMKNVTGYDLVRLLAGARGTLGVLTEVAFKVLARPEAEATLLARGLSAEAAVAKMSAALGTPWDVSGAAHVAGDEPRTLIRIEGLAGSVAYRRGALAGGLCDGWEVMTGEDSAALWREVRDVASFAKDGAVWRVSLRPSRAAGMLAALEAEGIVQQAQFDWGGGLLWLRTEATGDAGAAAIRAQTATLGGHATLIRADTDLRARIPVFQPEPAPVARLSAGLRERFDPRGILNPGLMG